MTDGRHISQDELALYAMQALSSEESAALRVHLDGCAECRGELALLRGDLALVAMSVEQHELPQGARERFMMRVAAESPQAAQEQESKVVAMTPRKPVLSGWIPWAVAAALAVSAVGLEMEVRQLRQQVRVEASLLDTQRTQNARAHAVMDLLTAPHAQHVMLTAANPHLEPTARAVYMASKGALILQASNMAPLPVGKMYELWVIPMSGAPVPAGMFKPDATGTASLVLPDMPKGIAAKAFGVTLENEQGASTPTMPILISGAAPAAGE